MKLNHDLITMKRKGLTCLLLGAFASWHAVAVEFDDFISTSGFGRVVAGQLNTNKAEFNGYDNELSMRPQSLLGLQINAQATDTLSLTAQAVIRTEEDSDSQVDWLYVTLQPANNLSLKIGKLRTPFFMHSDVLDVGYSYPWITPPHQMYNAFLFPIFEGVDISWGYSGNSYDSTFEAYLGQHKGSIFLSGTPVDYEVDALGGIIFSVRSNNIELRSSLHQGNVDLSLPQLDALSGLIQNLGSYPETVNSLSSENIVRLTQLGLHYDNLSYFAALEWVNIAPKLKTFVPEIDTYYVTGGYVFDPITIHVTYANSKLQYKSFPNEINQAINNTAPNDPRYIGLIQSSFGLNAITSLRSSDNLESWTIGARWDIKPKLALKADVTFLRGKEGENAM